jgi:hypothetical protein
MMTKNIKKLYAGIILGLALTMPLSSLSVNAQDNINAGSNTSYENTSNDISYSIGTETDSNADSSGYILNIGSISKMYVTAAVMQLVEQGKSRT